jgi:hypothetical protein
MMTTKFSDGHNEILKYVTDVFCITWYQVMTLDIFTKKMSDGKALHVDTLFLLG